MRFLLFVRKLYKDWPNTWAYGSSRLLLDSKYLEKCPRAPRTIGVAQVASLAQFKPEASILLLGL